jgi:hypothetical protein
MAHLVSTSDNFPSVGEIDKVKSLPKKERKAKVAELEKLWWAFPGTLDTWSRTLLTEINDAFLTIFAPGAGPKESDFTEVFSDMHTERYRELWDTYVNTVIRRAKEARASKLEAYPPTFVARLYFFLHFMDHIHDYIPLPTATVLVGFHDRLKRNRTVWTEVSV